MSDDAIKKLMNLDSIYIFGCMFLLFLIESDSNILDILYLVLISFYYLRIKHHRKSCSL